MRHSPVRSVITAVRTRVGAALFQRVAGPEGPANRERIHNAKGPRWFAPDRPIRQVHGDAAMFVGGLTALLLQSLHPLAMAAVADHSGYRGDPWGRLQRTSTFLAVTTFGTADDAAQAVARVRSIHERIRGTAPDGRPYCAADPNLLRWVHIAQVESFLRCHQRHGASPLVGAGCDGYVADCARVARELGVDSPPRDRAELARQLAEYRVELEGTPRARETADFLLRHPPVPLPARLPYAVLANAAVAELPGWARAPLALSHRPRTEAHLARPAGGALVSGIRWALGG